MADSLYVVDTHVLIWYLDGDRRLSANIKQVLDDRESRLLIPAIVLSEALFLLERKPNLYLLTEADLLREVEQDSRMQVVVLDWQTVVKTRECTAILEMHDRQIVATALLAMEAGFDVVILTKDENITASALVPVLW